MRQLWLGLFRYLDLLYLAVLPRDKRSITTSYIGVLRSICNVWSGCRYHYGHSDDSSLRCLGDDHVFGVFHIIHGVDRCGARTSNPLGAVVLSVRC